MAGVAVSRKDGLDLGGEVDLGVSGDREEKKEQEEGHGDLALMVGGVF